MRQLARAELLGGAYTPSKGMALSTSGAGTEFHVLAGKEQRTRLITVDAVTGKESEPVDLPGQVTSAVPTRHGIVAGHGNKLVRADGRKETALATTGRWSATSSQVFATGREGPGFRPAKGCCS
ncbi:hypothetical protein [Streptomyces sp. NPDC053728]|uniref:hypothetical protein n=1 Tax=Streptomyces sp. NPDC053728 TaxID=3155534 RepID=UPI0034341429